MIRNMDILKEYTLLFAENDENQNEIFTKAMRVYFKELYSTHDGLEAWKSFKEKPTDILITDIAMPKMDGFELIKKIRETKANTIVFITSAYNYSDYMIQAIDAKVDGYFLKPYGLDSIIERLISSTKILKIQEELREKDEIMISQARQAAMGEMISMIAHQWRQPITAIGMSVNNILADIELESFSTESAITCAQSVLEKVAHLSKTIDDFRFFLQPNKEKEDTSITNIINKTISLIQKTLENNGILFEIQITNDASIKTFESEVMQVLLNFISNSKDILKTREIKEPKIILQAVEDKNSIRISVCDNGMGVDEQHKDKIFNPYFSTKPNKNNTGLGIYMSKIITEKHLGGEIGFENTQEGACFFITIPTQG